MHRILIVDDDPTISALLGAMLSVHHEVVLADCGPAALRALDLQGPFDLIMVDWMMPGMDGVELIQRIRSERRAAGAVPIVMLTAKDGTNAEDEAFGAGADAYLTKPFDPDMLESLIDVTISSTGRPTMLHRASRVRPVLDGAELEGV